MVIFLTEDSSLFSISFHVMSINTVLGITLTSIKDPGTPAIILMLFSTFRNTYYLLFYLLFGFSSNSVSGACPT